MYAYCCILSQHCCLLWMYHLLYLVLLKSYDWLVSLSCIQPPLWERYQQQLKEWERTVARGNSAFTVGSQEKVTPPEKPPMFAFCLKPRGLDVPNKGSKQRSHRKFSVSGQHQSSLGDQDSPLVFGSIQFFPSTVSMFNTTSFVLLWNTYLFFLL